MSVSQVGHSAQVAAIRLLDESESLTILPFLVISDPSSATILSPLGSHAGTPGVQHSLPLTQAAVRFSICNKVWRGNKEKGQINGGVVGTTANDGWMDGSDGSDGLMVGRVDELMDAFQWLFDGNSTLKCVVSGLLGHIDVNLNRTTWESESLSRT